MKKTFGLVLLALFPISLTAQEPKPFEAKAFKAPVREFSVIATDSGYFPDKLFAYVGEKARFFVTATADSPQCFLLKDHDVFLAAEKGKLEEGQVAFKYPGRFEFFCPSTKFRGHITVVEKPGAKKKLKRETASVKKSHWSPRDFD